MFEIAIEMKIIIIIILPIFIVVAIFAAVDHKREADGVRCSVTVSAGA